MKKIEKISEDDLLKGKERFRGERHQAAYALSLLFVKINEIIDAVNMLLEEKKE